MSRLEGLRRPGSFGGGGEWGLGSGRKLRASPQVWQKVPVPVFYNSNARPLKKFNRSVTAHWVSRQLFCFCRNHGTHDVTRLGTYLATLAIKCGF